VTTPQPLTDAELAWLRQQLTDRHWPDVRRSHQIPRGAGVTVDADPLGRGWGCYLDWSREHWRGLELSEGEIAGRLRRATIYLRHVLACDGYAVRDPGCIVVGWVTIDGCACGHVLAAHHRRTGRCGAKNCICDRVRSRVVDCEPSDPRRRAYDDAALEARLKLTSATTPGAKLEAARASAAVARQSWVDEERELARKAGGR